MFKFISKRKKLWNPTPYPMELLFHRETEILQPFAELETTNDVFISCMLYDKAEVGLVCLNEEEVGAGESYDQYKLKKEIEGLTRILNYKKQRLQNEYAYVQEKRSKTNLSDSTPVESNIGMFEKDVEHLTKMLKEVNSEFAEEVQAEYVLPERPKQRTKKAKEIKEELIKEILK